jgi:F-type H+-transporting ATPase subunit b
MMTIDWWTLGLQTINFLVLAWLLQRFLYQPVLRVIARRKALAEQAFTEAEATKAEATAASQRYEHDRREFAETRQTLLQRTHSELEEERAQLLNAARAEAEQIIATARADLETERAAVLSALRIELAELALDMSAAVLSRFATSLEDGPELALSELEAQLDALPAAERERLSADHLNHDSPLRVVTAAQLDEEQRGRWQHALLRRLDPETRLEFAVDPALIGGAELHFSHALLSTAWSELLNQSREALLDDESPD